MGGRYCSMVAAGGGSGVPPGVDDDPVPALGLLLLGYPIHPAGAPERLRTEHFPRLGLPVLFVSGDRDTLAGRQALEKAARAIPGPVSMHFIEGVDHGYRSRRGTGRSQEDVLTEVAEVSSTWVNSLSHG
jgi:predicted alpha/beta-hydrolase family hydrolase